MTGRFADFAASGIALLLSRGRVAGHGRDAEASAASPQSPAVPVHDGPAAITAIILGLLLACHAVLLGDCIDQDFVTVDEAMHIPAGLSHWKFGDFSMYRVNPPLPRMIAVLPVLAEVPNTSGIIPLNGIGVRAEAYAAPAFARNNAASYMRLVSRARWAGIGWSLLGAYLLFRWARDLFGRPAGLLASALWCLGPNILAHAHLATPDVPATVAGLGACYAFWCYLKSPSWSFAASVGILLGLAQATKFTWLVLYAVWPFQALLYWIFRPDSAYRQAGLRTVAGQGCAIVAMSLLTINVTYGFDQTFVPLGRYDFVSRSILGEGDAGIDWRGEPLGALPVPLPAEYLRGIDVQRAEFEGRYKSYLRGEWRHVGWWYYYAYATAVKVPLGYLALVLLGVILTLAGHRFADRVDEVILWAPAVGIFVLVSVHTGINHHLRYVLPAFPFAMIATGKVARLLHRGRPSSWLAIGGLLAWGGLSAVSIHPHYLSYFNEAAGGPRRGHDHLVDSNIDWGQDVLFLRRWLDEHPEARPLHLAFYHRIDPCLFGLEYTLPQMEGEGGPTPGYYAISVNLLRGGLGMTDGKGGIAPITPHQFDYFRRLRPIARAGYSIYIYQIRPEDIATVGRHRDPPESRAAGLGGT